VTEQGYNGLRSPLVVGSQETHLLKWFRSG